MIKAIIKFVLGLFKKDDCSCGCGHQPEPRNKKKKSVGFSENIYRNIKTGKKYTVITNDAFCATNAYIGTRLVVYTDHEKCFVRDFNEFTEKFESIS